MKKICMAFATLACLLSSGLAFADEVGYGLVIDADGTLTGWTGTLPEEMVLPNGVTNIADGVFANCSGLKFVTIPNGVTNIGELAFQGCSSLMTVEGMGGLQIIGRGAFRGCEKLQSINLPPSVTQICLGAFVNCKSLDSIAIPGSVAILGEYVQTLYPQMETTTNKTSNGSSVTYTTSESASAYRQGCGVFEGCENLTLVTLGEGIAEIGYRAFAGCKKLKTVVFPESLREIDAGAFASCAALTDITLPVGLDKLGSVKSGPASATTTITKTYDGAGNLITSMTTGIAGMMCLNGGVFDRCVNLKSIQIPATVTWIGDETFARCVDLQTVEFLGDEPKIDGWCLFKGASSSAVIEVKKDANWYDPLTCERLQTWFGRTVSYEGERVVSMAAVDAETMKVRINDYVSFLSSTGASLTADEMAEFVSWGREIVERTPECLSAYQDLLTAIGVSLTVDEMASMTSWATSITSKAVSGGGVVVTNAATSGSSSSSGSSSGTGSSSGGGVAAQTVAANLTVTNVVVHYVQEVENVASVATATSGGLVAVVSEVLGSSMMSIPSSWTNSYPQFVEMFGDDFASALMKPSGKVGSDGAALQVWQDYVAGTDPTDPTSRFAATIDFVDGTPVVTWSPNVEDGSRVYRIWGKKSLADADWTQIDTASTADYNFFKVTVEMR